VAKADGRSTASIGRREGVHGSRGGFETFVSGRSHGRDSSSLASRCGGKWRRIGGGLARVIEHQSAPRKRDLTWQFTGLYQKPIVDEDLQSDFDTKITQRETPCEKVFMGGRAKWMRVKLYHFDHPSPSSPAP
jgi:hypothetical protein